MSHPLLFTRRDFLKVGSSLLATTSAVPWLLGRVDSALAGAEPEAVQPTKASRVLVVIQLAGGNDGLNTLVPLGQPEYYRLRPRIAIPEKEIIPLRTPKGTERDADKTANPLNDRFGLNPSLSAIAELFETGQAAVLPAVGYPNANRSHFVSMDIWQTGDAGLRESSAYRTDLASSIARSGGWIGRTLDALRVTPPGSSSAVGRDRATSVAMGREVPLVLRGARQCPLVVDRPDCLRWSGDACSAAISKSHRRMNAQDAGAPTESLDPLQLIRALSLESQLTGDRIEKALARGTRHEFPRTSLGTQLQSVSAMIASGFPARVYFVSIGGFDTHSEQVFRHNARLRELSEAVGAYQKELSTQGLSDRVLTMTFSEFGRQIAENASYGTDHGEAGPVFLFGPKVKPGVLAPAPKIGQAKAAPQSETMAAGPASDAISFATDMRSLYATVIGAWLGGNSEQVLRGKFEGVPIFRA